MTRILDLIVTTSLQLQYMTYLLWFNWSSIHEWTREVDRNIYIFGFDFMKMYRRSFFPSVLGEIAKAKGPRLSASASQKESL